MRRVSAVLPYNVGEEKRDWKEKNVKIPKNLLLSSKKRLGKRGNEK